ncbi:MAG TPA: FAD-dependent oxidoreductase [Candidatus Cybelea sp.]|nr:FAD-dependent oxidoreductase [Candidatus Cybelea sp.]
MSPGRTYDVIVIGAGVFGSWSAYFLEKSGAQVLLVDAYGPANARASSGGESRIIRMGYGPDEIYTRWSMNALPKWKELLAESGRPELFNPTGVLWIAHEGEKYPLDTMATLDKLGCRFEKLTLGQLVERHTAMSFEPDCWGIFEPDSGVLMARRAVETVVREAQKHGAAFENAFVRPPVAQRRRAQEITTGAGDTYSAAAFVFACGPWLEKTFPEVLGGRLFVSRQEVFFFGVPAGDQRFQPPTTPTWLNVGDEFYGMPDLENRGLKIAHDRHGPPADPDSESRVASAEALAAARVYLSRRFPALRDAPVVETRVCQYENTSNGDFLIDRHPEIDNVWLVGGGSGHGFKHGPSVGEYVAACVTRGDAVEARFSLRTKQERQKRAVF